MWRRFFDGPLETRAVLIALTFTLVAGLIAARYVRRLAAAGLRAVVRDTVATSSPLVLYPLRIVGTAAFVLVVGIVLFPSLELAGLRPRTGVHLRTLATWTFESGLKVTLIVLIAYALVKATALLVRRFEHEMTIGTNLDALERAKRARTLGSVVRNVLTALIVGSAVLMVLRELNIDIGPVLTGAGIVGLAVGFGAQTLVRDIISGFFLILENQVRVGDVAAINGTGGMVEAINLRTIVLRDIEGAVHVFPNGAINTLANRSKDYSYYVVDVSLSYFQDPDRVAEVVTATGEEMRADPTYGPLILEPIEILGIDTFTDWSAVMKMRIKTVPQKQFDVGRELRRRLIKAFVSHEFPFPFPVPASAIPPGSPPAGHPPDARQ